MSWQQHSASPCARKWYHNLTCVSSASSSSSLLLCAHALAFVASTVPSSLAHTGAPHGARAHPCGASLVAASSAAPACTPWGCTWPWQWLTRRKPTQHSIAHGQRCKLKVRCIRLTEVVGTACQLTISWRRSRLAATTSAQWPPASPRGGRAQASTQCVRQFNSGVARTASGAV